MLDVVLLSRLQFALTIMFHYLFPPLTIGMGVVLVYLEGMFLWTKQPIYESATKFWTGLFALTFAMGVATGIVMEFEFGTNWAGYSRFVGDVFGSPLAAEGIFAFFLESGFLAVLVFGWDKVTPKFHFLATVMVALGSMFSAIWIVVANSWQQTPAGYRVTPLLRDGVPWVVDGNPIMRAELTDFWAVVFNPSAMLRLTHVWIGAFILGSFFIMSISAYYLVRGRHPEFAKRSFSGALLFATFASLAALVSGDLHSREVARLQPSKLAAMEAVFATGPADLSLFGVPDTRREAVRGHLAIPGGLSLLLYGDTHAPVIGLDKFAPSDRPPVLLTFASFHLMIGLGMLFILLTLYASYLRLRGRLFEQRWLLWVFVFAVAGPFITNEAGWVTAEVGRQPWVVYPEMPRNPDGSLRVDASGFMSLDSPIGLRTRAAVSEAVSAGQVVGSIVMFALIYLVLFAIWLFLLDYKIRQGPEPVGDLAVRTTPEGLIAAAGARLLHDDSMTDAKEPPP